MSTSDELWAALYSIGADDVSEAKPVAVARLYELGIVEMGDGKAPVTAYGEKCFVVMESDEGEVPELDGPSPVDPRD